MTAETRVHVVGIPGAQGSKRHVGGGRMVEMSTRVAPWREAVRAEVQRATTRPLEGPVYVVLTFRLARPKAHYRTGRNAGRLRPDAPLWVRTRPDLDKLIRSTLDGMKSGGAYVDDAQVVIVTAEKVYAPHGHQPGATIIFWEVTQP